MYRSQLSLTTSIPERFHGPPRSGNGGYACGITAALLVGPAEVSLRLPPPLERPLVLTSTDGRSTLRDGDAVVAEAVETSAPIATPDPITLDEARAAAAEFDVDSYHAKHPFPGCFTCGPAREPGDGLRMFPGRIDRPTPTIAWPWSPDPSLPQRDGALDPTILWAALDCPSGLAWIHSDADRGPSVLGTLAAQIHRPLAPSEQAVVGGWVIDISGRKVRSGSAIWTADGEVVAAARAVWLELTAEQFARFGVASS